MPYTRVETRGTFQLTVSGPFHTQPLEPPTSPTRQSNVLRRHKQDISGTDDFLNEFSFALLQCMYKRSVKSILYKSHPVVYELREC